MFILAILIEIYSYVIFVLGLLGLLYQQYIVILTSLYVLLCIYWKREKIKTAFFLIKNFFKIPSFMKKTQFFLLVIIFLLAFINLIGALGPELGFDALWYHLILPKLYLENHSIFYIPGGLLYYSAMPKLGEMLYIGALSFGDEILGKIIHYAFGILSCLALYRLSRKFYSQTISFLIVLIFYSNLVVAWESITAYIDLTRTFFEIMTLWAFMNWWKKEERKWLVMSSLMLGLAITTKLLAVGSLMVFTMLLAYKFIGDTNKNARSFITNILVYWCIAFIVPAPWFIFSYIHTDNPIYPFFTKMYEVGFDIQLLSLMQFVSDLWSIFTKAADPISPIYIIFLPFIFLHFKKMRKELKIIAVYSLLALFIWYFTPKTGGGRFMLPYLAGYSIIIGEIIHIFMKKSKFLYAFSLSLVIFVGFVTIGYRAVANAKYVPVILGEQTKHDFLSKHLNFSFGDFYDTDSYFEKNIKKSDTVLLSGFHNLYYVDFPFIDSSWVKNTDTFSYIATQKSDIPQKFKDWQLIYENPKTRVKLYSKGGGK